MEIEEKLEELLSNYTEMVAELLGKEPNLNQMDNVYRLGQIIEKLVHIRTVWIKTLAELADKEGEPE